MICCDAQEWCRGDCGSAVRVNSLGTMMILDSHTTERLAPPGREAAVRSIFTLPKAQLAPHRHVALIGNYTPRKCGIATFTADIFDKLREFHPEIAVDVYALDDPH